MWEFGHCYNLIYPTFLSSIVRSIAAGLLLELGGTSPLLINLRLLPILPSFHFYPHVLSLIDPSSSNVEQSKSANTYTYRYGYEYEYSWFIWWMTTEPINICSFKQSIFIEECWPITNLMFITVYAKPIAYTETIDNDTSGCSCWNLCKQKTMLNQ